MLAAPDVTQLRALLEPELMPSGLAVNELIVGFGGFDSVVTTIVVFAVVEPAAFVAFSVYVVVAVGLTVVDPVSDVEVKAPGVIATLVASAVDQLSVLLAPAVMLAALAEKVLILGFLLTATVTRSVVEPASFVAVST